MKNTFKNKNLFYKKGIRVRHHLLQDKNATLRDKRIPGMPDPNKYAGPGYSAEYRFSGSV